MSHAAADQNGQYDDISDVEGVEQMEMVPQNTAKEKCVVLGCALSAACYISAMMKAEGDTMIYCAGAISLALTPAVVVLQRKLTDLEGNLSSFFCSALACQHTIFSFFNSLEHRTFYFTLQMYIDFNQL